MLTSTEQHSFLDVLTEEEAVSMGVNLSDKFAHHVYRAVLARSTAGSISREEFFTADTVVRELPGLSRPELVAVLADLVQERVVCQLFVLENQPGDRSLRVRPCFLARSERSGPLFPLFLQCLQRCETAVQARIAALERLGPEELQADLELDFSARKRPSVAQLLGLAGGLLSPLENEAFDITPSPELLTAVSGHVRRRLSEEHAVIALRGFGLAPLGPADARTRFAVAEQFLEDRILPFCRRDPLVRRELESISMDQALHMASEGRPTTSFTLRRAGAVGRKFVRETNGMTWFPGALTVEILLATGKLMEGRYEAEEDERRKARTHELLGRVQPESDPLRSEFLFLSGREWEEEHPDVRRALVGHADLLYATYELPGQTAHIVGPADPELFAQCVARLYGLPKAQAWKFWAAARLLELYAVRLRNLIADLRFQRDLEMSLYQNSRPYLKWPLVLLLIPGRLFPRFFVRRATEEMLRRQHALRETNRAMHAAHVLRLEGEREERVRLARIASLRDLIDGRLDDLYFRERRVPSVAELVYSFTGMDAELVREALRQGRYLLCPSRHAGGEESLVAFSVDNGWAYRVEQLKAHLGELAASADSAAPDRREKMRGRVETLRACLNDPRSWMTAARRPDRPEVEPTSVPADPETVAQYDASLARRGGSDIQQRPVTPGPSHIKRGVMTPSGGRYETLAAQAGEPIPEPKLFVAVSD